MKALVLALLAFAVFSPFASAHDEENTRGIACTFLQLQADISGLKAAQFIHSQLLCSLSGECSKETIAESERQAEAHEAAQKLFEATRIALCLGEESE